MLRNQIGHPRVFWGVETVVDFGLDGILAKTRRSDLHKTLLKVGNAYLCACNECWSSAVRRRFLRTLSRVRSSSHFLLTWSANPGHMVSGVPAVAKRSPKSLLDTFSPAQYLLERSEEDTRGAMRSRAVAHRICTTAAIPVVVQKLGLNHVSRTKSGISLKPMSLSL